MSKNNRRIILLPLIIALSIVLGMSISSYLNRRDMADMMMDFLLPPGGSKLDEVLGLLNELYVDSLDVSAMEEDAIRSLLKDLDPHSVYIAAKDMQGVNENMMGNFAGIGVQFYKYQDTVLVLKVVPQGPSEAAGIQSGDRIVRVNDSVIAGMKMNDKDIMSLLKGEVGTKAKLLIKRGKERETVEKTVTRGVIPINSINVAYMLNDTTGYIRVETFAMNTYEEFVLAIEKLETVGMKKLIVDLRDNEGGILPIALRMVNEFLPDKALILYTEGKASPRMDYYANGGGEYQKLPLILLINESSASASEIFAGAMQDNDRATIIGRRSFGKGLVQEQHQLPDGSALRLTVARYYVPSGRLIQRPYDEGKEKYYNDFYERFLHGEYSEKDSIHFDESQKFHTLKGRVVYGGGGIMPDVFVPADTLGYSPYLAELNRSMKLYNFSIEFMDTHRSDLAKMTSYVEMENYLNRYDILNMMADYAEKNGIKKDKKGLKESGEIIKNHIRAHIVRNMLGENEFYKVLEKTDATLKEAIFYQATP